jgi:hypothetical protein
MKRRADLGDHSRPRFGHAPMLRITLRDVKVSLPSAITLKTDAKRYLKSAAMILLTLPVLYFLSVGPVVWAWQKFDFSRFQAPTNVATVIYSPLEKLYKSDSNTGRLFKRYIDLVGGLDATAKK